MISDLKKDKDHKSKDKLEKIEQNIFSSRNEKERKMWEAIKRKLLNEHEKLKPS